MASAQDPRQVPKSKPIIPVATRPQEKPAPIITDYASL